MDEVKEPREFREERFEFALYVNDNLICKRNFRINNYIEESMHTLEFKQKVDELTALIDDDLKSKSRVWTWLNFDENYTDDELHSDLLEPWECTFKFVITDNKREVISKIWDGYGYPEMIRNRVDIANRFVKYTDKTGKSFSFEKNEFFEEKGDKLTPELYAVKAMIMDKQDLLSVITKEICAMCSPHEGSYKTIEDFTSSGTYKNVSVEYSSDGTPHFKYASKKTDKKYPFTPTQSMMKLSSELGAPISKKTKEYFANLY